MPGPATPIERPLRLATGLLLFTFATSHFLAHACGLLLLPAMEQARTVLLWPWRTLPGEALLASALLTHGGLGLWALYRRRHLRMPAADAWQLGLGLLIPVLLLPHGTVGLFADELIGKQLDYWWAIHTYWIRSPEIQLPRQLLLLAMVWLHGCIGLHGWLRLRPWYGRAAPVLGALALALPVLAYAGVINAGWDLERRLAADPQTAARLAPPPAGSPEAADRALLSRIGGRLVDGYLLLLVGTIALRGLRDWRARRRDGIRITYPGGKSVTVPRGYSVLEASRAAGIPHTALCGGRARCSTCRVRVGEGADRLPPPNAAETAVLQRLKAPPSVRLACQLRPVADLSIAPLLVPRRPQPELEEAPGHEGGRELPITAMFTDLRGSTTLAAGRLPFDALFIVSRYVDAVTDAVRARGGHITGIAGDGIMSVFASEIDPAGAARSALGAARDAWTAIDALSRELADELDQPLRFGIGIHSGLAVVGLVGCADERAMRFIGDTGNVAARLEEMTKELDATVILSDLAAAQAGCAWLARIEGRQVAIRGRDGTLGIRLVRTRRELEGLLAT